MTTRIHILDTSTGVLSIHHQEGVFDQKHVYRDGIRYRIMMAVNEDNEVIFREERKPDQKYPPTSKYQPTNPRTIQEMYGGKKNRK